MESPSNGMKLTYPRYMEQSKVEKFAFLTYPRYMEQSKVEKFAFFDCFQ